MDRPRLRFVLYVCVIAVFVAARFWRLEATCLWFDEMFSVQAAEQPWGGMFGFLALDLVHPPLFYILLKVWIAVGGESVFWLRTLPVVFGCLAIVPLILIMREIDLENKDKWWPLLTLFLVAANGSLIKYAQEVRMYTMLMFISLVSIWLFLRCLRRDDGWLLLMAVNIVLVYTHYYGWLVVGCEVLAILIFQQSQWRRVAAMFAAVLAAFLPWMLIIAGSARSNDLGQNIDWIERPGFRTLMQFALRQLEPFYFPVSSLEPVSIYAISIPVLLIVLCSVAFAFTRRGRQGRLDIKVLGLFASLPVCVAVVASYILPYSVWGTRHMIIIAGPLMLLLALAVLRVPSNIFRAAAVTLLILFAGYAAVLQAARGTPDYVWCGWEKLINDLRPRDDQPVLIYTSENLAAYHAWFATRHTGRYVVSIVPPAEPSPADREYFPPRGTDAIRKGLGVTDVGGNNIILLYRVERPLMTDWLLQALTSRGYKPCAPRVIQSGPSTAFRVEMTRDAGNCIYPF